MGINIVYNLSNQETKAFISNKIALAAEYYKNKAVYYYGRFTGQIPSDYILQHSREWRQFAPVCDALVLDSHQSEYLFHIFVQSRNEVFNAIMAEVSAQNDSTDTTREPGFRPQRRFNFDRYSEEFASAFGKKVNDELPPQELALAVEILGSREIVPIPELRGLRAVRLSDTQREKLKPLAMSLMKSELAALPQPASGTMWVPMPPEPTVRRETMPTGIDPRFDRDKQAFLENVKKILSKKQVEKWITNSQEAQKNIESDRERFPTRSLRFSYDQRSGRDNNSPTNRSPRPRFESSNSGRGK